MFFWLFHSKTAFSESFSCQLLHKIKQIFCLLTIRCLYLKVVITHLIFIIDSIDEIGLVCDVLCFYGRLPVFRGIYIDCLCGLAIMIYWKTFKHWNFLYIYIFLNFIGIRINVHYVSDWNVSDNFLCTILSKKKLFVHHAMMQV